MSDLVFCIRCPNLMDRATAKWSDWDEGYLCSECRAIDRDEGYITVAVVPPGMMRIVDAPIQYATPPYKRDDRER